MNDTHPTSTMAATADSPVSATGRRGEALLYVLQNNTEQSLTIHRINPVMEELLGVPLNSLIGQPLSSILGEKSRAFLNEEIEFQDDAADLADILARQRELRLKRADGTECVALCAVTRLLTVGTSLCFQLAIPCEQETAATQKLRGFIHTNLAGRAQLDEVTGLPNRATASEFLPLIQNCLSESDVKASFAVLRIDRHQKSVARYGVQGAQEILKHAANCCKSAFRADDILFALSDHTLGLLLFDIGRDSARVVLNRLRWAIRSHHIHFGDKPNFSVTVTIAFDMLTGQNRDGLLDACEEAIAAVDVDERNGLLELS